MIDSKKGEEPFTQQIQEAIDTAASHAADIVDVCNYYFQKRSKPRQTHNLTTFKCDRGEQVEVARAVLKHFANPGMAPMLAQALTMEGVATYNADRLKVAAYDNFESDSCEVVHYKPWLQIDINELCDRLGLPSRYPAVRMPEPDTGEQFLWDYLCA